jgi:hypothetical protein
MKAKWKKVTAAGFWRWRLRREVKKAGYVGGWEGCVWRMAHCRHFTSCETADRWDPAHHRVHNCCFTTRDRALAEVRNPDLHFLSQNESTCDLWQSFQLEKLHRWCLIQILSSNVAPNTSRHTENVGRSIWTPKGLYLRTFSVHDLRSICSSAPYCCKSANETVVFSKMEIWRKCSRDGIIPKGLWTPRSLDLTSFDFLWCLQQQRPVSTHWEPVLKMPVELRPRILAESKMFWRWCIKHL